MNKFLTLLVLAACGGLWGETVNLTVGDDEGYSSLTNGAHWSDAAVPAAANDYLVALGDEAPLRTLDIQAGTDINRWSGGTLQIGTVGGASGALWLMEYTNSETVAAGANHPDYYPRFQADALVLANGTLRFTQTGFQRLLGHATVTAPASAPFTFALAKGSKFLQAGLIGGEGTAVQFTNASTDATPANHRIYLVGDNSGYVGSFLFDGVTLSISTELTTSAMGFAGTDTQTKALMFRNGALIRPNFLWTNQPGNYDGTATIAAGTRELAFLDATAGFFPGIKSTLVCNAPVRAETLKVYGEWNNSSSRITRRNRLILNGPLNVKAFALANATDWGGSYKDFPRLVFGPDANPSASAEIGGMEGGTIGAKGCAVTVLRKLTGTDSYFESDFDDDETTLGHVTLAEGSTLGTGTLYIRVEGFPLRATAGEFPVLSVPTSLRAELAKTDVVLKTLDWNDSPLGYDVRTANGLHTVWVKFTEGAATQRFVVPASSVNPETYTDDKTYNTRATAATNLADAISVAAAGDTIYVAKGVHDITQTIVLEKDVKVVGFDFTVCKADAGAILDGGYPARTNRIMKLKKAKLTHLTFRNGATTATGYYSGNATGGGAICLGDSTFRITDCLFIGNHTFGTKGGGALASHAVRGAFFCTRCTFTGNTADSDSDGGVSQHQYDSTTDKFGYQDCIFSNNVSSAGKVSCIHSSTRGLQLKGCTFTGNSGPAVKSADTIMTDCVFDGTGSPANSNWQAFYIAYDSPTNTVVSNVTIRNYASPSGSLFGACMGRLENIVATNNTCSYVSRTYTDGDSGRHIVYRNCLFADNAIKNNFALCGHLYEHFENCTVTHNTIPASNAYFTDISSYYCRVTLTNCIFWANGTTKSMENFNTAKTYNNSLTVADSIFDVSINGANDARVSTANPKFVRPAAGDYTLRHSSPARDTATTLPWMRADALDLAGNPRVITDALPLVRRSDALPDMGCFECTLPHRSTWVSVR